MRKCNITVYDYYDARHNSSPSHYDKENPPEVIRYDVDAYCVQGDEGFRAFWIQDDQLYTAHGDDGHWWLNSVMAAHWAPEMAEALLETIKDQT